MIVILGDSHIDGWYGQELEDRIVNSGAKVTRIGVQSSRVSDWIARCQAGTVPIDASTQIVFVGLGSNDWGMNPVEFARRALDLAQRMDALAPGVDKVWIGPPQMRSDASWVVNQLDGILPPHWLLIDSWAITEGLPRLADGIHYTREGAIEWSNRTWTALREARTSQQADEGAGAADSGAKPPPAADSIGGVPSNVFWGIAGLLGVVAVRAVLGRVRR